MNAVGEVLDRKDRPAYVRFERKAKEDKKASLAAGHYVGKDVDFVYVTPPYSKDILIFEVEAWLKQLNHDMSRGRLPQEWVQNYRKAYEAWKRGEELPPEGTPIKGWGVISPAQQETLIRMQILTVEDLAAVNDEGGKRIGMGWVDLKNKAKAWLAQLKDKGPLTQEMAAIKAENRELHTQVNTLQGQVEALLSAAKVEREVQPPANSATAGISMSDLVEDDYETLAAKYKAQHGRLPHPAMSIENLRAKVA